jgi:hypothetical protein
MSDRFFSGSYPRLMACTTKISFFAVAPRLDRSVAVILLLSAFCADKRFLFRLPHSVNLRDSEEHDHR